MLFRSLESFYTRLDNAATAVEYDVITEEQINYLQKNFDEPALRGMAFLSDDGCNIYTAIILRGPVLGADGDDESEPGAEAGQGGGRARQGGCERCCHHDREPRVAPV